MSSKEEGDPSWMDEDYDETHSLMFGSEEGMGQNDSRNNSNKGSVDEGYGATDEEARGGKSVISVISAASTHGESSIIGGPRKNIILNVFHFIEAFSIVTCATLLVTQLLPLFFIPLSDINPSSLVLKFYISIFCVVFILVEYDVSVGFLKESKILQNYFSRGFVYSFLGVSALQEAYSERVQDTVGHQMDEFHISWLGVFMQVTAWMMFSVGTLYMLLSLCCMKKLRDSLQQNNRRKWKEFRAAKKILREQRF